MSKIQQTIIAVLAILLVGFGLIQLIPYGRDHMNPPVVQDAPWQTAQAREIAVRACYDCHSNETVWPWYSNIAPLSWLVQRDVEEGRQYLNFSTWGSGEQEVEEIAEVVWNGEMPMPIYLITHPEARLTDAEKQTLLDGLGLSAGFENAGQENEHEDGDND